MCFARKCFFSSIFLLSLIGCASAPAVAPVYSSDEIAVFNKRLENIKKVEILYSNDNGIVVLDQGGSGVAGLGGLLGPIGAIAAAAADAASKKNAAERAKTRSVEYAKKVREVLPQYNLSRDYAEAVASKIRSTGREAVIKPLVSERSATDLAKYPELTSVEKGSAAIVIWNNPGFFAESATSAYVASTGIDYYCQDSEGVKIVDGRILRRGAEVSSTYSNLLDDISNSYQKLRAAYLEKPEIVVDECLTVPKQKRSTDRLTTPTR
jgi:hypothetical protein